MGRIPDIGNDKVQDLWKRETHQQVIKSQNGIEDKYVQNLLRTATL